VASEGGDGKTLADERDERADVSSSRREENIVKNLSF